MAKMNSFSSSLAERLSTPITISHVSIKANVVSSLAVLQIVTLLFLSVLFGFNYANKHIDASKEYPAAPGSASHVNSSAVISASPSNRTNRNF